MMRMRSRSEVLAIMRRVGMGDRIAEAQQRLPEVVDLTRDDPLLYDLGLTLDQLVNRLGGSPW
jgi:hypothetical protein